METRNLRVLIIEDDEFVAMAYEDQLKDSERVSFYIEIHGTLTEGLNQLSEKDFDVLLLDLNLPDSDYQNTIDQIPSIAHEIPVIVLTSTNDEELALKTMNLGAQDYMNKDKLEYQSMLRSMLYGIERHRLKIELRAAKAKSEELLANILPQDVIKEIKEQGSATAKKFEEATIIFTDFVGFTSISENLDAADLVTELDTCFRAFDRITESHGVEKIKTIGDAYMAAGGIPKPSESAVSNTVRAAIEMRDFISDRAEQQAKSGKPYFNMRIGVHTGPVVAGIVGVKKFQYDIWGDTVNTASRMEANGDSGKVNISSSTYNKIKDNLDFEFISRGSMPVKGKGLLDMWFVDRSGNRPKEVDSAISSREI
jgi:class 3 adenylate cyclase